MDPDPYGSACILNADPDPGGENLRGKTEKMQGKWKKNYKNKLSPQEIFDQLGL